MSGSAVRLWFIIIIRETDITAATCAERNDLVTDMAEPRRVPGVAMSDMMSDMERHKNAQAGITEVA